MLLFLPHKYVNKGSSTPDMEQRPSAGANI